MAKRNVPSILMFGMAECLLGKMFLPRRRGGAVIAIYSGDMIAARLRDEEGMTIAEARSFVTDQMETSWFGNGTYGIIWAAGEDDFASAVQDDVA